MEFDETAAERLDIYGREPWIALQPLGESNPLSVVQIQDADGNQIGTFDYASLRDHNNVQRLLACIKACAGIPTAELAQRAKETTRHEQRETG